MTGGERGVKIGGDASGSIIITGDNNIVHHGPTSSPAASKPWNVPHPHNPFFTGRKDILVQLRAILAADKSAALTQPQAISGLGGIGKTQTAVEYAYRFQQDYQAVLWAQADTETTLTTEFARIAALLALPETQAQDLDKTREAVKRWLTETADYLLILDNADDPARLKLFLPSNPAGHILLTSRARDFAVLHIDAPLILPVLSSEDAVAFLLHRTGRKATETAERAAAIELAEELGGLPLALEQAAAYIAVHQSRFQDYLVSYRKRALALLEKQGPETGGYEKTVAVTWAINFEAVAAASEASAEMLRISAFLAPNRIPEELFVVGAPDLGEMLAAALAGAKEDRLLLDELLEPLARYSLILRDIEARTYDIHRLVQAVIRHDMVEETQRRYSTRSVRAVNRIFPDVDIHTWPLCERLLPHARVCTQYYAIDCASGFQEAMRLLNQISYYLCTHALYSDAEFFSKQALSARQQVLGSEHPDVALSLNNLAELYVAQGMYTDAEPLLERAFSIWNEVLGPVHPSTALSLNNLAGLYYTQGKYADAEPLLKRALSIREQTLGQEHPETASNLNNLAELYRSQGNYGAAEPLYQRALTINEKIQGLEHPDTARTLNNLALLYKAQGRCADAEPLLKRALSIREQTLGQEHPETASNLNNLAELYREQGGYEAATPLYRRALAIMEKTLGQEHPETATILSNIGLVYGGKGDYPQSLSWCQRALAIREKTLGPEHPSVAQSLNNLAGIYFAQGNYGAAAPLLKRVLTIYRNVLGLEHPDTMAARRNYSALQLKINPPGKFW